MRNVMNNVRLSNHPAVAMAIVTPTNLATTNTALPTGLLSMAPTVWLSISRLMVCVTLSTDIAIPSRIIVASAMSTISFSSSTRLNMVTAGEKAIIAMPIVRRMT